MCTAKLNKGLSFHPILEEDFQTLILKLPSPSVNPVIQLPRDIGRITESVSTSVPEALLAVNADSEVLAFKSEECTWIILVN